jgi:hypothetical protein
LLDLNLIGTILRDYGLPLTILIVFGWLVLSGRLRAENEVKQLVATLKAEIEFRERLRSEDRQARLDAEQRVTEMTTVLREQAGLLQEISRDILRGQARGPRDDSH